MMSNSFEEYLEAVKALRDKDGYRYTNEDFIRYSSWIETCFRKEISAYKCLELMWFETDGAKQKIKDMYGL